jgi:hypothetical protein
MQIISLALLVAGASAAAIQARAPQTEWSEWSSSACTTATVTETETSTGWATAWSTAYATETATATTTAYETTVSLHCHPSL